MTASPSRTERQVHRWIMRMIDDPDRHAAGLARWIGDSEERLAIYNRVAREMKAASWSAAQLYETRELRPARTSGSTSLILTYAVVILGFAAAGIGIAHLFGSDGVHIGAHPELAAFDAPDSSDRSLRLEDGSSIVLRHGSHLDVHLTSLVRDVYLTRGAAEFRVAHAARWPFVVHAGGGSVTARGTIFTVAVDQQVSVRLTEGAIDVAPPTLADGRPARVAHLRAGENIRYAAVARLADAGPSRQTAPQEGPGMKSFDGVAVGTVIAETNHGSSTRIELDDPYIAARVVTLQFHRGDPADVADGLAEYLGLFVDRSQPGLLILRKSD